MFMRASTRSALTSLAVHRAIGVGLVATFFSEASIFRLEANPTGEQVVAGQAEVERLGSTLTIHQATDRAIIHWQDFSIQQGELTKFLQPSSSSATLNRVVGGNLSQIYGTLEANGTIVLVNPSGITVGPSGVIDVGTFMGSTLDVSNDQFLQGTDLDFVGTSPSAITNLGRIEASEDVFLFAQQVDNRGLIRAGTEASLAAGQHIHLRQAGDDRISVRVGTTDEVSADRLRNSGEVQAAMVTMKATGSAYSAAVNNTGVIRATGAAKVNGRVLLTGNGGNILSSGTIAAKNANGSGGEIKLQAGSNATRTATVVNSGTLEATGTTGGRVEVTGDRVALTGNALVDVSGASGGGTALIGGDWQGGNPEVQNAQRAFVGSDAVIKADAVESGNGGTVVVWADGDTRFQGALSARGGAAGGNGGRAEVSGKETLIFEGRSDLSAPAGSWGSLLLDPRNITINNTGTATLADVDAFSDTPGADVAINAATINAALANVMLQANNDIVFQNNVNIAAAGVGLTARAGRSVTIANGVSVTLNAGNFWVTINDQDADSTHRFGGVAVFGMAAGSSIVTNGGHFTQTVGTFGSSQVGVVSLNNATINAGGGSIDMSGFRADSALAAVNIAGNSVVTTTGPGTISISGTQLSTGIANTVALQILGGSLIEAQNGLISLTGTGTANSVGDNNRGVAILSGATVRTTGSGGITITGSRGSGNNSNRDVVISGLGTTIESSATGTGAILIQSGAPVGTVAANSNVGIDVGSQAVIRSLNATGGSNITINGTGSGVGLGQGVSIGGASQVTTVSGNIAITGTGSSTATGTTNTGVVINGSVVETSGAGAITINGTGGTGTSGNEGVRIVNAGAAVRSTATGTGAISITGTALASTTGFQNAGVAIINSAEVLSLNSTGGSTITISGQAGGGTSNNVGVVVSGSNASVRSASGSVSITGTGAGTGLNNLGVLIGSTALVQVADANLAINGTGSSDGTDVGNAGVRMSGAGVIETTGTGAITITGTGGSGTSQVHGIEMRDAGTRITSTATGTGAITLNGTGGTGTSDNSGIVIQLGADIESLNPTGGSSIALTGLGGGNTGANRGISVGGSGTIITTQSGDITITGTGGGTVTSNNGVTFSIASVTAANGANITIAGTGGGTGASNGGVTFNNSTVTVENGNLTVTGTGSPTATGSGNAGITVGAGGGASTLQATGTGSITLTGTGGPGTPILAVDIFQSDIITTSGDILISAASPTSNVRVGGAAASVVTGSGNMTFQARTVLDASLTDGALATTSGTILFAGAAAGDTIGVNGGAGTTSVLSSKINLGTSGILHLGSATAGNITFGTTAANVAGGTSVILQTAGAVVSGTAVNDLTFGGGSGTGTLVLLSANGVGTAGNRFVVQSGGLTMGATVTGGVFLTSNGGLTIGDTSSVGGPATTSIAGGASIRAGSPITFAVNTSTTGGATYTSVDDGAAGADNITVNSGVQVDDDTSLTFQAGDSFVLTDNTSVVIAPSISITAAFNDTDNDGAITLNNGVLGDGTTTSITLNSAAFTGGGFGGMTQLATGVITTNALALQGGGAASLIGTANAINALATTGAYDGDVTVVNGASIALENITLNNADLSVTSVGLTQGAAFGVNTGTGTITLDGTTGAVQIDGAITSTNATASALLVRGLTIAQAASGVINVAGTSRFVSTSATAGNVTITNDQNLALLDGLLSDPDPAFLVGGNLVVNVNGDLTQNLGISGDGRAIAVAGTATLNATTETVTADNDNIFGGGVTTGTGIIISKVGVITLGTGAGQTSLVNPVTGDLTIISQESGFQFTGALDTAAGISLAGANQMNEVSVRTATAAGSGFVSNAQTGIRQDAGGTGTINMTGVGSTLTLITEASSGNTAGTTRGSILLDDAANVLGSNVVFNVQETNVASFGDVLLTHSGANSVNIAPSTLRRNLTINSTNAAADFTQSGAIVGTTSSRLIANVAGSIDFGGFANVFGFLGGTAAGDDVVTGGDFRFRNANALTLTGSRSLIANSGAGLVRIDLDAGGLTQGASHDLQANELAVVTTGVGNVVLTSTLNQVGTIAAEVADGQLSMRESDNLIIGSVDGINGISLLAANRNLALAIGGTLTAIGATAPISIAGTTGTVEIQADTIGASGSPIFIDGSYTLQAEALSGGIFIENQSANATVTVANVNPGGGFLNPIVPAATGLAALGGDIEMVLSGATSNLTVGATVNAGVDLLLDATNNITINSATAAAANAVITAGNDLTTTATINGTDIALTSGGALTYGANVGTTGTTTSIVIDNTGILTRTVNTATMNADEVTFQGNGGTGTGATNGLRVNTLALILDKGAATTPIRVNNVNAGVMDLEGTVGASFSLITSGGVQITDNDLVFSGNNVLVDIRSAGSITKQSANARIDFTGTGNREVVLRAAGSGTVGTAGSTAQGDSDPSLVTDGLLVNNATRLAGIANGGFFLINDSTTALEIGAVNTGAIFAGLGTTTGVQGNAGVEIYTEGGLNVTQNVLATTNGYIAVVGNHANGLVTINANVRNNATAGTGTVIIEGTPAVNVAPVSGVADVLISDRNPTGGIIVDTNLTGNVLLKANDDFIVGALLNHTGVTATLTIEADADNDGGGGIVFLSGNNGINDVHGRIATNGLLDLFASELINDYSGATILDPGSNPILPTYVVALPSRNNLGSNIPGDGNAGNGIVLASNVFAALGAPQISKTGAGELVFEIKPVSDNASVVKLDGNRAITAPLASIYFLGNGDVGVNSLGAVNPLRTQIAGVRFDKATFDIHLREFDGLTFTQASQANRLVLEAGTNSDGTDSPGSGAVNQSGTAVLTLNELNIANRRGAVLLDSETNFVSEISLGNASGNFLYLGGIDLALTGPIISGNTTTLNVGTFDIDQSFAASISAISVINLTFRDFNMRSAINAGTSGTVNIFNLGDLLNLNPVVANRITANTLNITDQAAGGGSIGLNTTSTTLTNNVTGGPGDNFDGFIRTTVATVNLSKTTGVDGGSNGRQVNLLEFDGIQLGSVNMDGDLFIATQNTGGILQNPANGVVIGGQAQFITANGSITLNSNVLNDINAFGRVIALNGHFRYLTTVTAPDNEVNFNGLIQTTGGTALNPSDVQITFGADNDLVFAADGDIFSNDVVTFTRFGGGSGQVRTAGNITTSGDDITLTSADGVLNIRLEGNVLHTTNGVGPNPFTGGINPALPGNVLYNGTVDSDALGGPFDLTVNAGTGNITFQFTVGSSALALPAVPVGLALNNLVVNSAGITLFNDDVTAATLITDFDPAQRGGTTIINGGIDAVVTTGFQIYNDAVVITDTDAATTNLDGTNIEFNGTLNTQAGNTFVNLTINDAGTTRFNGNVGTTRALQTLTANSNQIFINGQSTAASNFTPAAPDAAGITIRTVGTQNYNATAGIFIGGGTTAPSVLTTHNGAGDTTAGDILFATSVNGFVDGVTATAAGQNDLVLIAGTETDATATGNIVFGDTVGVTTQMGDILIPVVNDVTMATSATDVIFATTFIQAFGFGTNLVSGGIRTTSDVTPTFVPTFVAPANLPNVVQAATFAGGVQISTDQIIVNRNILAENNGIIRLNGLNAASDVVIIGGTVETTGSIPNATRAAIGITAGDDIIIGDLSQTRSSIVRTTDGAITLTARNQTNDAFQGIFVQAGSGANPNNDAFVQAQGANGFLTVTATQNQGLLIVNGGNSNGAQAELSSTQFMTVDADRIILLGGGANNAFASLSSANGQDIRARNTAGSAAAILLQGGSGGNNARAQIENQAASQLVRADSGSIVLLGGDGQNADARIRATAASLNQTITVSDGNLILTGGTNATDGGDALIVLAGGGVGAQTITVSDPAPAGQGLILLTGGTGVDAIASIQSNRTQTITAAKGITVQGGQGDDSIARIRQTGATTAQTITVTEGNLNVLGGRGIGAASFIDATGTAQTITVSDGALLVRGDLNADGTDGSVNLFGFPVAAYILSTGDAAVQTINVTNGGIEIRGGADLNESAGIAQVGANGRQLIQALVDGDIFIFGGDGVDASAGIASNGINGGGQEAQRIVITNGNLRLDAGSFGIGTGSLAVIQTTNTGTATQFIEVNGVDGNGTIVLRGGQNDGEAARIQADGFDGAINGLAQSIRAQSGMTVRGGEGLGSTATVIATGGNGRQLVTVTTGDLDILGGDGQDAFAEIAAAGLNGAGPTEQTQRIVLGEGHLVVEGGAGGGTGAFAAIRQTNPGLASQFVQIAATASLLGGAADNNSAIISSAGAVAQTLSLGDGLIIAGGSALGTDAGVLATGTGVAQTVSVAVGDADLTGGSGAGVTAFIEQTDVVGTQVIALVGPGSLSVRGGDGEDSDAFIRAAGSEQTITVGNGALSVIANQDNAADNSDAFITATNVAAVQLIDVTNGGIVVQGGAGTGETASISMTGAFGRQAIRALVDGDVQILGGSGDNSTASILSAGLNFGLGLQAQRLVVEAGQLLVQAGIGTGTGATATIASTNLGAASQFIAVEGASGTDGMLSLLGGDADNNTATILSQGNAAQTLTLARGLSIAGGTAFNSAAGIRASGNGASQSVTVTTGNGLLIGGSGDQSGVFIEQTSVAGTQVITLSGGSGTSDLVLLGGDGEDSDARLTAAGSFQQIIVANGSLTVTANQDLGADNSDAWIEALNTASMQLITVGGAGQLVILGGAGVDETAGIVANGLQTITVANGLSVTGGTGTNGLAFIDKVGNGSFGQTITVTAGNLDVTGGDGENAVARVESNGLTQTINVNNGALRVRANQNATNANSRAIITATNLDAVQTLNVTQGGVVVLGGAGTNESATISMTGANGRQSIHLITDGDLLVQGGDGQDSLALITSAGINGGGSQAQRIVLDAGQLIVRGNSEATNSGGTATISQTNTDANTTQFIQVGGTSGTDGRLTVIGGAGDGEIALISSAGRGPLGQQIFAASNLTVQGGTGTDASAAITHAASILGGAANGQSITVGGNLLLQGGFGQDAFAQVQGNRDQTITVHGNALILADPNGVNGGGFAEINQTPFVGTSQTMTINGTGGLTLTGGTGNEDYASINKALSTGTQTITVANGGITLNGGNGLAVADNFARIRSAATGAQTINWNNAQALVLNANQGASNDPIFGAALTNYGAGILSVGTQNIGTTSGGSITLNGGTDTGAAALIGVTVGAQNLTARGPLNVNGGSAAQTSAQIRSLIQLQTVNVAGNINVTGNGTAAADNFAIIRSGLGQTITTTASGNLIVTANASSSTGAEGTTAGGLGAGLVTGGTQTLTIAGRLDVFGGSQNNAVIDQTTGALSSQTIVVGGSINLADGSAGDAYINANSTTAAGQQITATGAINLEANEGNIARITAADNQLITTAQTLNLSGITVAGSEALIQGGISRLNINGAGASQWNGGAFYEAAVSATINNNGAIDVNEQPGFTGGVTTPLLVFVTGQGRVGATTGGPNAANTRLNTFVDEIFFNGVGTKTVNISEDDGVDLRGTVGTVNLITMNTGDITTNTAALNASTAVFQTADGDIDLGGSTNQVNTFQGLIANNGSITYNGGGATTFANRALSAEVLAGDGVFADGDITTTTVGNSVFTTNVVRSTGGNIDMTAATIVFNAAAAPVGGTTTSLNDGLIITQVGTQTYNGPVALQKNTRMQALGGFGNDDVTFNGTITGPGGLTIGSTPNFNGNVGGPAPLQPLAFLILNSPVESNFNANGGFVVVNGSLLNQGGGFFNINGINQTFIVDAGSIGIGPGVFAGGNMVNNSGGLFTIYGSTPAQVTGSLIGGLPQQFFAWRVFGPSQFDLSRGVLGAVNFKSPFDPFDPFDKERLVRRKVVVRYDLAYNEGRIPAGYAQILGVPNIPAGKIGGMIASSYRVIPEVQIQQTQFTDVYQQR